MPWVGFEPTIPASERAKRIHALDRSGTVTGTLNNIIIIIISSSSSSSSSSRSSSSSSSSRSSSSSGGGGVGIKTYYLGGLLDSSYAILVG
jgi:hypothetical protein